MIFDRDAEIRKMYIGNPMAILGRRVVDFLQEELLRLHNKDINKENIENFVKLCKEKVHKEIGRKIYIDVPFLLTATEKDWKRARENYDYFIWLEDCNITLEEKPEDRELRELFNTFPIEGY